MPSPIVHSAAGYVVYRFSRRSLPGVWTRRIGPISILLIVIQVFSLMPDLDAIPGLTTGEFGKYHNNGTHSLIVSLVVAVSLGLAFSWKRKGEFLFWFLVIFASYGTHILLDYFTWGARGVMLFWPFSLERYHSSLALFYGVHWSDGILSIYHLWTVLTEAIFVLVLLLVVFLAEHRIYRVAGRENA